jgi:hypothetical protein
MVQKSSNAIIVILIILQETPYSNHASKSHEYGANPRKQNLNPMNYFVFQRERNQ